MNHIFIAPLFLPMKGCIMILKFILAYILCGILWAAYFWNSANSDGKIDSYLNDLRHKLSWDPRFTSDTVDIMVKLIVSVSIIFVVITWPRIILRWIISLIYA